MPRTLPVIRSWAELEQWRQGLNPLVNRPATPRAPRNFKVTNQRGGNLLEWAAVSGADGYEVLKSTSTDFTDPEIIPLRSPEGTAYFDSLSGSGAAVTVTRHYKVRATAGTSTNPHSVLGKLTGMISSTSIDAADVATASTVQSDPVVQDDGYDGGGRPGRGQYLY